MQATSAEETQRIYARIAGFLYLFLIVTYMAGVFAIAGIPAAGDFAETARNIAASSRLYSLALSSQLVTSVGTVLLAYSLYQTLKPIQRGLARLALYWRLGDAFIGGAALIFRFQSLHLYTRPDYAAAFTVDQLQALVSFTRDAYGLAIDVSAVFFTVGSTLFFYLFFRSRYIPRLLSGFGLFASLLAFIMAFADLIYPEYLGVLQYGWHPILIAEIVTGAWLLFFGIKTRKSSQAA